MKLWAEKEIDNVKICYYGAYILWVTFRLNDSFFYLSVYIRRKYTLL